MIARFYMGNKKDGWLWGLECDDVLYTSIASIDMVETKGTKGIQIVFLMFLFVIGWRRNGKQ